MKKKIVYYLYLALFAVIICLQLKYRFDLQESTDGFSGLSFVAPGNLSYMIVGAALTFESWLASKNTTQTRLIGRMIIALILIIEMFKLPVMNSFSLLNEWGYVLSTPGLISGYFLLNSVIDIVSILPKKGRP